MNWELIQTILGYISGPLIGAVIGLFTNYLAVKMLFRPLHPIKLGKWTLPFTPGIIPKRREALAKAIGKAVGEELFTPDDLKNMLCSAEVEEKIVTSVKSAVNEYASRSIDDIAASLTSETNAEALKDTLSGVLAEKVIGAASKMNIGELVATKGKEAILEKKSSMGMLGMFLTDGIIDPLLEQVKEKITSFIDEEGLDTALPAVRDEVSAICAAPLNEQLDLSKLDGEKVTALLISLYENAVLKAVCCATESLDIASVVEAKINQMDIKDLETLCLSVMKKELNAVVYLGGVIGLVLGIVNIFI